MEIDVLFKRAVDMGASDLHLRVGLPPILRIDGRLKRQEDFPILIDADAMQMLEQIMSQEQRIRLFADKELDFSCAFGSQARFRVNVMWQRKCLVLLVVYCPSKCHQLMSWNYLRFVRT